MVCKVGSARRRRWIPPLALSMTVIIGSVTILSDQAQPEQRAPVRSDRAAVIAEVAKVRGRVVDGDTGLRLRRVRIRATSTRATPDDRVTSTLTDASGTFELEVPGGIYLITAAKAGYETRAHGQNDVRSDKGAPLDLRAGVVRTGVDFALRRGGAITGTVVDEFGEPLENATVQVARSQYSNWQRRLIPVSVAGTRTDDRGGFRISGLPPGDYYVAASFNQLAGVRDSETREGYSLTYYPGTVNPETAQPVRLVAAQQFSGVTITLVPERLATIAGTVETNGLPVAAATVGLLPNARGGLRSGGGMMAPLRGNTFSFSGLPAGEYSVMVSTPDTADPRLGGIVDVVLAGENVDQLIISLTRGVTLRGRITFEGALERPNIPVQLQAESLDTMGGAVAAVQDDGTFELAGIHGKRVRVTSLARGWWAKHLWVGGVDVIDEPIVLDGRDIDDIELVLTQRLSGLAGTVRDAQGDSLPNVQIVAFAENPSRWKYGTRYVTTMRADGSGNFTVASLPPERYVIVAVEGFSPGDETDPDALERWARAGTTVTLAESGTQFVRLRGTVR